MAAKDSKKHSEKNDSKESKDSKASDDSEFEGDQLLFDEKSESKKSKLNENNNNSEKNSSKEDKEQDDEDYFNPKHSSKSSTKKKCRAENEDCITIKIPKIKGFMLERIVYIVAIIFLLIVLLTSGGININLGSSNKTASNATTAIEFNDTEYNQTEQISDSTNETIDDSAKEYFGIVENNCIAVGEDFEGQKFSGEGECARALIEGVGLEGDFIGSCEGDIKVEIVRINMNSENTRRVEDVIIKITNNDNSTFGEFYADLVWYNNDDEAIIRFNPKLKESPDSTIAGLYPFTNQNIRRCGGEKTITLNTELASTFVSTREIDNTFRIRLHDYEDNSEIIASATRTLPRE
ncbi:MAG: hypothetical protein ACMXX5_02155 [Candidatus Woesearchaeota archaeon]